MPGELVWFELGVDDVERGRKFYEDLFGWHFEPGPSGSGFAIQTPNLPGGMHGGNPGAAPYRGRLSDSTSRPPDPARSEVTSRSVCSVTRIPSQTADRRISARCRLT